MASPIFYHIIDDLFGRMGSNNSHYYTGKPHVVNGPPHSFPLFMGSDESAPSRRINWHWEDTSIILISALVLFIIRRLVIERIVALVKFIAGRRRTKHNQDPKALRRVEENAWFALYYICSSIAGVLILKDTPWFWDFAHLVYGYPEEHTGYEYSNVRLYLLIGGGFYAQALVTLLFIDEKLKDFLEMLIHHFVTIALIVFCITSHYHRIGTLVLILHDIVDIFLYSAKAFKHMGVGFITEVLFVLFVISYFLLRLMYLPYLIYRAFENFQGWDYPSRYYMVRFVQDAIYPLEVSDYGVCAFKYCLSTYWLLVALLVVLVFLHIFWFSLISKIIFRKLAGKDLSDIREDDEKESDHEESDDAAAIKSIHTSKKKKQD
ncbi:hypothetical protein C9374_000874 [Naegleria lovaniensis]|uniref:TLC domain-containing protein n=1 Tax=Naegleria lovaniensis TaxID=51637 RepID=A0AA88GYI3_NAELO|nr:uncharacterized protein C9374_000874 [Naegleria lovaniensis]KAG2388024.1 hypothetical protein C9374_000874 [Naegleria lovaniensis]